MEQEEYKLYMNNCGRKSFQWELWMYCNSLCDFCYLGKDNRVYNVDRQKQSLIDLNKALDNMDFTKYNNISLIGGEFFQGQLADKDVNKMFFDTIRKIFQLYLDKKIGSMWITCTLTLGEQNDLYKLLDIAEEMGVKPNEQYGSSGLWLCTSWDTKGRFHNDAMKNNWEHHMLNIKKKYPWVKFNTTIILQKAFIKDYLEGKFNVKEFENKFSTTLFFKQCGIPPLLTSYNNYDARDFLEARMEDKKRFQEKMEFFPTRSEFIKFLIKFKEQDYACYDRLFNIMYRADELHRNFLQKEHDQTNIRVKDGEGTEEKNLGNVLPCGHTDSYAAYIDNNACCICDRNAIDGAM